MNLKMEQNKDIFKGENESYGIMAMDTSSPSISKSDNPQTNPNVKRSRIARQTSTIQNPHNWTEDEKMKLAVALQKYGILDISKIQEDIPTKSCEQIKIYVNWIIKKSKLWYNNGATPGCNSIPRPGGKFIKAPLDQWLGLLEQNQGSYRDELRECLAKTFLYISRYEPHPDQEDCDGIDFAAMYEFLYLAVKGLPVKAVNPETASAILEALDELSILVKIAENEKETEFLSRVKRLVFVENATKRHYGKKDKNKKPSGPIESLMDVKGFNPLNIPYDMLKRRQGKNQDDPIDVEMDLVNQH